MLALFEIKIGLFCVLKILFTLQIKEDFSKNKTQKQFYKI